MRNIPWSQPDFGELERNAILETFDNDWLTMGPRVKKFEAEMAEFVGAKHAIAVSNGSVAIDIALLIEGIQAGDEIIVPSNTYFATAAAVNRVGGVPVFADIEDKTWNLDPTKLADAVTDKTKGVIFIDYGGNPAQIDELKAEAKRLGLFIIQDAAQSLGGTYKGKPVGANTDISTMSFHMAKILACVEGGMIFTQRDDYADEARIYRNQGESSKYHHSHLGFNARMTDMTACIGSAQFSKLTHYLEKRAEQAARYDAAFTGHNGITLMPCVQEDATHANFAHTFMVKNRADVVAALKENGVDTRVPYPMTVYNQEVYKSGKAPSRTNASPIAERVCAEVLSLPMYPLMTQDDQDYIIDVVKKVIG